VANEQERKSANVERRVGDTPFFYIRNEKYLDFLFEAAGSRVYIRVEWKKPVRAWCFSPPLTTAFLLTWNAY
jgi:hypothetical protein